MKEIFFLILFWISTIGYCLYAKYKFKIKSELLLAFVFSIITLTIFILGLLNILKLGSYLILFIGIILFIFNVKKHGIEIIKKLKILNLNIIIIALLMLYVTIVFSKLHLLHYDNFTHWGLIIKNMLIYNRLPNFENALIEFKGYQPGTACFIYYFTQFFGLKEGMMIVAQNYLFIAFISSILVFAKGKYKNLFRFLCVFVIIFSSIANILPYDLLVDSVLSVIFIFAFVIIYEYKDNLKKLFYALLIISLFLCLVKNTGYVFTFMLCIIYLLIGVKNKKIKQGFMGALIIGLSSLALLYIWMAHVRYVYGYYALSSHHSLTPNNIYYHLLELGKSGMLRFLKIYITKFIDLKTNITSFIVLLINLIVFSFLTFYKNKRKTIIKSIVIIDIIYIIYYLFLGIMYICSMEISGLYELAGFQRYMLTIAIVLIVIAIMLFMHISESFKSKFVVLGYTVLIIFLLSLYIIKYENKDFKLNSTIKLFIGENCSESSYIIKYDKIVTPDYINMNNDELYYVYYPSEKQQYGYLYFISKYKLNHENIVTSFDTDSIVEYTDNSLIVVFEYDKEIKKKMKEIDFCKIKEGLYGKCKD